MVRYAHNRYSAMGRGMLDETTRFLSWALKHPEYFPAIPRFRVDSGRKFPERFKRAYWKMAIDHLDEIPIPDNEG